GVASNSPRFIITNLLEGAGLISVVDSYVGVDEVKSGKPEPDLILAALERLSVTASEACYVGDSVYDREASAAARVHFIGYKRSGDSRIDHLTDLLGL